jgi:hypothetical protein
MQQHFNIDFAEIRKIRESRGRCLDLAESQGIAEAL